MSDDTEIIPFYGPGVEAGLSPRGRRCHLAISVDTQTHAGADAVRLEVLFQPREQRGLPNGGSVVLYASNWPLRPLGAKGPPIAEGWLPRALEPALARQCYYRVTPIIMASSRN